MNEICLGTIGTGAIVHIILEKASRVPGIRLCAVYSREKDRGEALAAEFGAQRVYTALDAFLRDDEINFVYIASPNILHYPHAKAALLAGKNVILEKPFCTKASHAAELVALAKERRLFLIDATPTAFLPNLKILQRVLPQIGPVRMVLGNYTQYSARYDKLLQGEVPNVFNPAFGGGALMDLNYYNAYLTVTLFGKPRDICYYPNIYRDLADTSGTLILRYPDFVAQCVAAKDCRGESSYHIQGERGSIEIPGGSNGISSVRLVTEDGEHILNSQQNADRWSYEIQTLAELVLSDDYDTIYANLERMIEVITTLDSARESAGIRFPGDE